MKPRIMYIELKTQAGGHNDRGPAYISRVTFSKTGKTIYWRGKTLQRGAMGCGNYFDSETREEYWISGPKKNGEDRFPWAGEKVSIDPDVRQEYWTEIRKQPERTREEFT
jgi:hypothetical protein